MEEISKQISIFMPVFEWLLLRQEAARLKISVAELGRRQLRPLIKRLAKRRESVQP